MKDKIKKGEYITFKMRTGCDYPLIERKIKKRVDLTLREIFEINKFSVTSTFGGRFEPEIDIEEISPYIKGLIKEVYKMGISGKSWESVKRKFFK